MTTAVAGTAQNWRYSYCRQPALMYTVFQKCRCFVLLYNVDTHEPILIIFDRKVTAKERNQNTHYCSTSSNSHALLHCLEIASVHLNTACGFANKHTKHKKYHLSQLNHPSLSKRLTGYTRPDVGREQSILQYVTLTLSRPLFTLLPH